MLVSRSNDTTLIYRFLLLLITGILFSPSTVLHADEVKHERTSQINRADADTIKLLTHQILSEKDFTPRKTFWQWLEEKLFKLRRPKLNLGQGWTNIICWIIIIWCILTLIAILIHFIWTICVLIRTNVNSSAVKRTKGSQSVKVTSFEELYKMTQELARKGEFREAIGMMTIALLRWLESIDIVRFHESKTNGDYFREYPSDYAGRDEFRRFVLLFEQTIYGGIQSNGQIYRQMNSLMEDVRGRVRQ